MRRLVIVERVTPAVSAAAVWMRQRSRREQVLIAFFGGFVLLTLFWFAAPRPLLEARSSAMARIATYESIKARVAAAGAGPVVAPLPDGPVETALSIQASTFALTPASVARQGGDIVIAINDARYDSVVPWLAALEGGGAVAVTAVKMQSRPVPGMVNVELRVREP